MASRIHGAEPTMDPTSLYREEVFTDRRVGTIRVLIPVTKDGLADGTRKVLSIQELVGMEGPVVTMQEIFRFVATGQEPDGKIRGHFEATGIVPRCVERLRLAGVQLSPAIFERGRRVPRAA